MTNEYVSPSTRWQALLGTLPFLAFGISTMIGKVDHIYRLRAHHADLAVYAFALVGLLIGWIRGFPLWSYSYLGWSLLLAWAYTNNGTKWNSQIGIPFGIMVLIALLWTRSLTPLKKFLRDCWNDWTRLSLMMYAMGAWVWMIYDENHHPYLVVFVFISALVATAATWVFMQSSSTKSRVLSIIAGFIIGKIISDINYATWDYRAYFGFPEPTQTRTWFQSFGISISIITFWLAILFWPAFIALIHRIINRRPV